jgi:iron complex transport system permease protein
MAKIDIIKQQYERFNRRKMIIGLIIAGIGLVIIYYSLHTGPINLNAWQILKVLVGSGNKIQHLVIWNIRLPRILAAIIAGTSLSLAGCAMQCLLRNPLASPFTMGISQGAAFGAAFAIIGLHIGQEPVTEVPIIATSPYIITLFAFSGAFAGIMVILTLAKLSRLSAYSMVLAGVATGSLFTAATMLLQYFAEDIEVASVVFWTFGDVSRANIVDVSLMFFIGTAALVYFIFKRHDFNAMQIGEETAKSLGVNTEGLRFVGILAAALITAVSVAFLGIIGFVGLVGPHVTRRLIGGDHRFLIPISALTGSVLLLAADTAARTVMAPTVLPVGILTSFMGAPLFIYLIIKKRE